MRHHIMKTPIQPFMGEEDDPEYGYREPSQPDETRALANLQQLACELSALRATQAAVETALERVCEHVMRDPVYSESTRDVFRSTLASLRARGDAI